MRLVFESLPFSIEVLEGVTAMIAVVMLFYVSFWLVARMEHKRWMEFVRARLWSAVSLGSTFSLIMVGFTAVYREGFETALFYQALWSFGAGLGKWVLAGFVTGLVALTGVALGHVPSGSPRAHQAVHDHRRRVRHADIRDIPR